MRPGTQKEYQKRMRDLSNKKVQKSMKQYKADVNASRQLVQQMKMQEAQALAEIPLEETLVSSESSGKGDPDDDDDEDDATPDEDYDEERDKEEVERQIKKARYAS